ncbi:hypothetical protein BC938DRAFT_474734 [Jimgerdemannia flammicorona]|uniref:MACPF-like domain-containing protein n=1 Tax=Jimgerdemannia flammicorona TaxID=994334 RepID=A0A433Q1P6_9FUNG|nr:hypothetical protein BC938DRAFT_474734 [Jimgerdemannia flammicorona]
MSSQTRGAPLTEEFRLQKYKTLKLNYAMKASGEQANEPCVELRVPNTPPAYDPTDQYQTEEIECQSGRTEKFIQNGCSSMAIKLIAPIVAVNLEASDSNAQRNINTNFQKIYRQVQTYGAATVFLTSEYVKPTDNFIGKIKEALKNGSNVDKHRELTRLWDRFGYVWSQVLIIGGKLETSANHRKEGHATDSRVEGGFEGSLLTPVEPGANARIGLSISEQNGRASLTTFDDCQKMNNTCIIGGGANPDALRDTATWCKNIAKTPEHWIIVKRESIKPIYDLLDSTLRSEVLAVINSALDHKRIRGNSVVQLWNRKTQLFLQWSDKYLTNKTVHAFMTYTSPIFSGEPGTHTWELVPEASSQNPYIRYNDVLRIRQEQLPNYRISRYLHGSIDTPSPMRKSKYENGTRPKPGDEVSLRELDSRSVTETEEWVIERVEDSQNGNIEDLGQDRLYVRDRDLVRLRLAAAQTYYLASHDIKLDKMPYRKQTGDFLTKKFTKNGKRAREVLLFNTEKNECSEQEDVWEVRVFDRR